MLNTSDLNEFINKHITHRSQSLLQADLEKFHDDLAQRIDGRAVLVIGGAGSIGSQYIKAILKFRIAKLVVVDTNENGLTELVRDLRSATGYNLPSSTGYNLPDDFITYPVDFGSPVFEKLFRKHGPFNIVSNFAAHKHVRSEKDIFSIEAMIENNVLKARKLLDLLLSSPPEHFFCVSTDKAANPVNIMGASKKLMEELIMAYSGKLKITTARFANVAFSNGSLPLGFLERLQKQQPWSCPLGIKRFFVSPQESGELCLLASVLGQSGDIIYPKLDAEKDMVSFDQIALDLLHFLGMEADVCPSEEVAKEKMLLLNGAIELGSQGVRELGSQRVRESENSNISDSLILHCSDSGSTKRYPVYFFKSDNSGEKPYEEFYTEDEVRDEETFLNLGLIRNSKKRDIVEIDGIFDQLQSLFDKKEVNKPDIVKILKSFLPDFDHLETGRGLDGKM